MKKAEAEKAIRQLCDMWARDVGLDRHAPDFHPGFGSFTNWLDQKGYRHYLNFRSRCGAAYDAEQWFDQEFGQTWRN